jgi:hypothetical protein
MATAEGESVTPPVAPARVDDRPDVSAARYASLPKCRRSSDRGARAIKRALFAAAIVLGGLSPAGAMTGNELREHCATRRDLCHGFIIGAVGMFWYQMEIINPICFGTDVTWEQVHDVVVNYLEEHPEVRQEHALVSVTWAIREAFDCPDTEGRRTGNEENGGDPRQGSAVGAAPDAP